MRQYGSNLQPPMTRETGLVHAVPPSVGNYHALIAAAPTLTDFQATKGGKKKVENLIILSTSDGV